MTHCSEVQSTWETQGGTRLREVVRLPLSQGVATTTPPCCCGPRAHVGNSSLSAAPGGPECPHATSSPNPSLGKLTHTTSANGYVFSRPPGKVIYEKMYTKVGKKLKRHIVETLFSLTHSQRNAD